MNNDLRESETKHVPIHAGLFTVAAAIFGIALFTPATNGMPGWYAFVQTIVGPLAAWVNAPLVGVWKTVKTIVLMLPGTIANATLIASAMLGWEHRGQAVLFFRWSLAGCVAGLAVPFGVGALDIGYWLWLAALALVAAGWGSVVWHQKRTPTVAAASRVAGESRAPLS